MTQDIWEREWVLSQPGFVNEHLGPRSAIAFDALPLLPKLELKLYWARLLSDERKNSRSIVERRLKPMDWLNRCWGQIADHFGVSSLSQIPNPEFNYLGLTASEAKRQHNPQFLNLFERFAGGHTPQTSRQVVDGELLMGQHRSPRLTIAGDIHKSIVMQRDQFLTLNARHIIFLNDLYDEEDTRFKDRQRHSDVYLNLFLYPTWMRDAVRSHVLNKVEHGELAPSTLRGYFGRFLILRDFMHEKYEDPHPLLISESLIEEDFIAWGNERELSGKNWWTDTVALLNSAAKAYPHLWPSLSIDRRRSRKIKKGYYQQGSGRVGHHQESAGRSYSQRIINDIANNLHELPAPVPAIFTLILATGARSEDGHALLFDCLKPDPSDDQFMLLTYWQNKVRRYNTKPLFKQDKSHWYLITMIEQQRELVLKKYGQPTKYLFPYVTGSKESYLDPSWTRQQLKQLCLCRDIRDDEGKPLSFSWHPLRHTKGTSMAAEGHDILSIMMELGHSSPAMATVYVNNRLELKKNALLAKGSGRFFDIQGLVDDKIGDLLVKKEQLGATRVCGGACSMPAQIGDWCAHANACYTCKYFRADSKDLAFFEAEYSQLTELMEVQAQEILAYEASGRQRLADITGRRQRKNAEVAQSLESIILAMKEDGLYRGRESNSRKYELNHE